MRRRFSSALQPGSGAWQKLRWAVLVVALVTANLLWSGHAAVPALSFPHTTPSPPLRITSITTSLADDRTTVSVEMNVRNEGTVSHNGRIWWQLAPVGTRGRPFDRRAYESAFSFVHLPAEQEARLSWTEQALVPPGMYRIDAWAEVRRGPQLIPSDARSGGDPLPLEPADTGLLRHGPPDTGVAIASASAAEEVDSGDLSADVHVENRDGATRRGWLRWTVSTVDGRPLVDWRYWAGSASVPRYQDVPLLPESDLVVHLDYPKPLQTGQYALRVSLSLDDSTRADLEQRPDDDVLVLSPLPPPLSLEPGPPVE